MKTNLYRKRSLSFGGMKCDTGGIIFYFRKIEVKTYKNVFE